jgi:hypothetical protein
MSLLDLFLLTVAGVAIFLCVSWAWDDWNDDRNRRDKQ